MKNIIYILFIFPLVGIGQNYIQDGSFEDTIECPNAGLSLSKWYRPSGGSSDLFCSCRPPDSLLGWPYQNKLAFNQDCFTGLVLYYDQSPNFREYIESEMLQSLDSGSKYCVTLFTIHSTQSNYTIKNFHIGFRNDSTKQQNSEILKVDTFYRFETNIIKDSVNWTKIELEFIANGTEKYLSIGNFDSIQNVIYDDYNAITNPPYLSNSSYYFFDLITLEKCVDPEVSPEPHYSIYPNPSSGGNIYIDKYADTTAQITLYNALGQQVGVRNLPARAYKGVVFEQLANGVYVVVYVTASGYREEKKVVVI